MTYLVMENRLSYSVVLDETGAFHRVANLGYEVGERVSDVVMMEGFFEGCERKTGISRVRKISSIVAVAACLMLALIPMMNIIMSAEATIIMNINPKVEIRVDEDDKVTDLDPKNKDGEALIERYTYEEKHIDTVTADLLARAVEMGFLKDGKKISVDINAEDEEWGKTLGTGIADSIDSLGKGKYSVIIRINGEGYIERAVISAPDNKNKSRDTRSYEQSDHDGGSYYNDHQPGTDQGGGNSTPSQPSDSGYGDSNYGNSGYGDSGYGGDDDGDSGYDD